MNRGVESLLPHEALLWACTATCNEQEVLAALTQTLNASRVDWPACARMSIRHGLASIAAYHLGTFTADSRIPAEAKTCFARMYRANGGRNQVLFRECGRLLRGFQAAGIRCMVLKGVGLALTAYPDPALRNFADIDLLIAPGDLDRASAIAQSLGFSPRHSEADDCVLHRTFVGSCEEDILTETLPLEYEEDALRARADRFRHEVIVEIHQGLFRDAAGLIRRGDNTALWQSPRQAILPDGTPILLPSYEVMVVHLAAHAADHGFGRLIYFHDIALTVRQAGQAIDWDRVLDLAECFSVSDHVSRCLEFVCRECCVAIPPRVLTALAGHDGRRLRPLQRSTILSAEREFSTGIVLQRLLLEPDWRRFISALCNILFPPPVIMRRLYHVRHPLLVALLYVLRPILLTEHLIRLGLRRLTKRGGRAAIHA